MRTFLLKQRDTFLIWPLAFAMLAASLFISPISSMFEGYLRILMSPGILLTDYFVVGGLAATLFNAATTLIFQLLMLKGLKVHISGPVYAGLLTITGFAFFGKTIFNPLPLYLGIWLYSKATKTAFRNHIIVLLFSTGIAPIVSFLLFGANLPLLAAIPVAIVAGAAIGFLLPAFGAHALRFHQGYNLYNTGFAMGVISMFATAILNTFGIPVVTQSGVDNTHHAAFMIAILAFSSICILFSFVEKGRPLANLIALWKRSGRLVSDFVRDHGHPTALFNIGLMGIFSFVLIATTPIKINGPVLGAVLTIMGFAAFGKHPVNSLPVVLGAILAIVLTPIEWTMGPILAVLFVTGLAPLAGRFGFVAGIVAGFVHLLITSRALAFQGGFDLYNNGFAAGFVGAVLAPIFHTFRPRKEGDPI
jgi:hypothetical protein